MALTDLNGPSSVQPPSAGSCRNLRLASLAVSIVVFLCSTFFFAGVSCAQDQQNQSVADAARQERARKRELRERTTHVYTDADLKRAHILTPEDRATVEARKEECARKNNCSPAPTQNPPAALDANSGTHGASLGEVAREYRKKKELQALKPKQSEPFHLPISEPAFASPVLPERPAIRPPAPPPLRPKTSPNVFRRDPFSSVPVPQNISPGVHAEDSSGARENFRSEFHPNSRSNVSEEVRPIARSVIHRGVPENLRPTLGSGVHPAVSEGIRPSSPEKPNVSIREELRSVVRSKIYAGTRNDIRPTIRSHARILARPKSNIYLPSPPARSFVKPAQPMILAHPSPGEIFAKTAPPLASIGTAGAPRPVRPLPSTAVPPPITVTVRRGDSLWSLALQNMGRGSLWPELLSANRWIANPNRIRVGARLALPVAEATASAPRKATGNFASSPGENVSSSMRIQKGDTLWSIARSHFGRGALWPCLARANPSITDVNLVFQGHLLFLPKSCGP